MKARGSSRLVALVVFLVIVVLGESVALLEEYQNNQFFRQYLSDNALATIGETLILIFLGIGSASLAYRRSSRPPGKKGPGPFSHLGTLITKRHRTVIAVWILLVIASLPLATMVSNATTSQSGNTNANQSESARAQNVITQEFPRPTFNTSALVVIQSRDVTDNATKLFVLSLESRLLAQGELSYLRNLTSIYGVERTILLDGIAFDTFVIYSVPGIYLQNWLLNSSQNVTTIRDSQANATTIQYLTSSQFAGPSSTGLILGYYNTFYQYWRASSNDTALVKNPPQREAQAINMTVPAFAPKLPGASLTSLFKAVYSLGANPSSTAMGNLADQTIVSGSLSTYPIALPSSLLQQFISPRNDTMLVIVAFSKSPGTFGSIESDPILKDVQSMRAVIATLLLLDPGPTRIYVTGDAATTVDSSLASTQDFSKVEPTTIAAIILLVAIFFLAVVTPIIPLASIGLAIVMAEGLVYIIGKFVVPVQDTTLLFLTTIMLGVGTDYAIFLIARYREERVGGRIKADAVHTSVTWVGESIATSGLTVILAFGALSIGSFSLLQSLGLAVGTGVMVALLVSLTLIPSIIMLAGDRIFWPTSGKRFERYAAKIREKRLARPSYFRRAAARSVSKPKLVLLIALALSIPAIYISFTAATSYDFIAGLPNSESVQGLNALQQTFGAGRIGPTQVVVQFQTSILQSNGLTAIGDQGLEHLSSAIAALSNVQQVDSPTRPLGVTVDATNLTALGASTAAMVRAEVGKDSQIALLSVILVQEPFTTASLAAVQQIRSTTAQLQKSDSTLANTTILVGGQTASTQDFAQQTIDSFTTMRIVVLAGIFVILLLVLGSYILPLAAILSIGLSITWSYGLTVVVFNHVLNAQVLFLIPLILFLLLFGIGMDYNIFILTRIREEAQKGKSTRDAVVDAVDRTGGIITALALILAGALGSLMLSSNQMLQGFGFAIAVAVVLDAMVVRTYIVPASMALLGKWAWWGPRPLQRVKFDRPNKGSADAPAATVQPENSRQSTAKA
jgi:RND superfamily putative drug exporter